MQSTHTQLICVTAPRLIQGGEARHSEIISHKHTAVRNVAKHHRTLCHSHSLKHPKCI
jgi:hypothetical protein